MRFNLIKRIYKRKEFFEFLYFKHNIFNFFRKIKHFVRDFIKYQNKNKILMSFKMNTQSSSSFSSILLLQPL